MQVIIKLIDLIANLIHTSESIDILHQSLKAYLSGDLDNITRKQDKVLDRFIGDIKLKISNNQEMNIVYTAFDMYLNDDIDNMTIKQDRIFNDFLKQVKKTIENMILESHTIQNDTCSICHKTKEQLFSSVNIECEISSNIDVDSGLSPAQKAIRELENRTGLNLNFNTIKLNTMEMDTEFRRDYSNDFNND